MSEIGETCGGGESKSKRRKIEESKSQQEIEIRNKYGPQVGDTVDILDLLFTDSRDFLIKSNGQKVKVDDLVGKTIVVCMLSLAECCHHKFTGSGMMDLVEAYNELRVQDGVEFVFVPKRRGLAKTRNGGVPKQCSVKLKEECFNSLFTKMPWPAVPFSDKQACHRIEKVFWPCFPSFKNLPYYAILDRKGRVLLTNTYNCFKTYCQFEYSPLQPIFHLYGGADLFSLADLSLQNLRERDKEAFKKLDLDQLLASPSRDFLLARDGTKEMPWLVHPYSLEFGRAWTSKFCYGYGDSDGDGYSATKDRLLTFNGHGELVMEEHDVNGLIPSESERRKTSYPFNHPDLNMITSILDNVAENYFPYIGFAYW